MIRFSFIALIAGALMAQTPAATPKAATPTTTPKSATPAAAPKAAAPAAAVPDRDPGLYATIATSMGQIVLVLYEKETPIAVNNFVALSRGTKPWTDPKTGQKVTRPLYSGTIFHRVIPDFMIQAGDPTGTGMGNGGLTPIRDEFNPALRYDRPGRLGLARLNELNTGTCQFFITDAPYETLSGKYTLFGQVVEGQDVVHKIANVPRDANDKPNTPVRIANIKITRYPLAPPVTTKKAAPTTTKAAAPSAPKAATTPAPATPKKAATPATK